MTDKITVSLMAAMSADGSIALHPNHLSTEWTSKEDLQRFISITKRAGALIIGNTTFKTFRKGPLQGRLNVVYTNQPNSKEDTVNLMYTNSSPSDLLLSLQNAGTKEVIICGGASIYKKFLPYVQKLYLTIEPVLFGSGIRLWGDNQTINKKLRLLSSTTTSGGTIFADYELVEAS